MLKPIGLLTVVAATLCVMASPAFADVITFNQGVNGYLSGSDTWVGGHHSSNQVGDVGQNQNSTVVQVRGTRSSGSSWTSDLGLIRFDDILAANHPTSAGGPFIDDGGFLQTQINSATMTINLTNVSGDSSIRFFRMGVDWDPANIIYNSFNADGARGIQTGSGEAITPFLDEFTPGNADPLKNVATTGTKEVDVTAALQAWVNGEPNYGFLISGQATDTNPDALQFSSFNNATLGLRPFLTIDFTVVPEPASIAMWGAVAVLGGAVYWRRRKKLAAAA